MSSADDTRSMWREDFARLEALARNVQQVDDGGLAPAVALAELQREIGWKLRDVVAAAREQGVSWRELADGLGMPAMTLHRQYQAGKALFAAGRQPAVRSGPVRAAPAPVEPPALPLDQFVGREQELSDLRPLLAGNRLVTLLGPGGVGKTRLAREFVATARRSFRAGIWWADLAPLTQPSQVGPAIVAATAASWRPGQSAEQAVAGACTGGTALLVLDNGEHLVDTCADLVTRLLHTCPGLRLLVTSREPLRTPGEVSLPVPPLPVALDDPYRSAAVLLYVDRARAVQPGFALTDASAPAVAALCAQLDGLPLAIELAARQVAVRPPQAWLERTDQLDLLAGGTRTAAARHQSLRSAIEWSYDLLDEGEQAVFRRLSILPGGFGDAGAAAMCADLELAAGKLWATVLDLLTKSLLAPDPAAQGRFRILQSLQAFGLEQLQAAGELPAAQERLLGWLADMAAGFNYELGDLREITAEWHNLRHAHTIAAQTGSDRHPGLTVAVAVLARSAGDLNPADEVLDRLLAVRTDCTPETTLALVVKASLMSLRGQYAEARDLAEDSLRQAVELGHLELILRAQINLIYALHGLDEVTSAVAICEEQVILLRGLGQPERLGRALNNLAWSLLGVKRYEQAGEVADEALLLQQAHSDPHALTCVLNTTGAVALCLDQLDRAAECFSVALTNPAENDSRYIGIEGMAAIAVASGSPERALRLFATAATARAATGIVGEPWWIRLVEEAAHSVRLPPAAVRKAEAEGVGCTVDDAISYAVTGVWPTPARARRGLPLSTAEIRVAELVAEGLTDRQIAARLHISPRTVTSRLERVRTKLNVTGRAGVAAWLTRQPVPACS